MGDRSVIGGVKKFSLPFVEEYDFVRSEAFWYEASKTDCLENSVELSPELGRLSQYGRRGFRREATQ